MIIKCIYKISTGLIILILISCSEPVESELLNIDISQNKIDDIPLSDIASSIDLIQLETAYGAYISLIWDVKRFDRKYYIKDLNRQILIFNEDGSFNKKLVKSGEGPGESKFINSFAIDENSGKVYIGAQRKLSVYSSDHEFIKEKIISEYLDYLTFIEGKLYAISEFAMKPVPNGFANGAIMYSVDSSLNLQDTIILRDVILQKKTVTGYPFNQFVSSHGSNYSIYTPFLPQENILRDTLFEFKENKLYPKVKFNFTKPYFDDHGNKIIKIYNLWDSKSYLICEYFFDGSKMLYIYNKNSKEGFNLKEGFIDGDGDKVILRPLDLEENIFYYVKAVEFADKSIEEANPLIGIVKLK